MTIGDFWSAMTVACHAFDGRVTSGPRCVLDNADVKGVANSAHLGSMAADLVLREWGLKDACMAFLKRQGVVVVDEVEKKNHLHCQGV